MTKSFKFKLLLVLLVGVFLLLQHGCWLLGLFASMEIFSSNSWGFCLLSFIPVAVYDNADTQNLEIIYENKGKSGVYRWVNFENKSLIFLNSERALCARSAEHPRLCPRHFKRNNILHNLSPSIQHVIT
uniref:Uncharacterized protein n=1 Tax=Orbilia brochopaga TaxID=3140254 RepID=A0A4Y5MZT1_9PEZI|nr:hypothetical protein [Drechslerella brochopaga]